MVSCCCCWCCCCCWVAKSCLTLCDPVDCSTLGFPALHHLPEFTQTRVLWVSDAIQPSHPLSPPSPPVLNLSQHQGLFRWVDSLYQMAKGLELQYYISDIRRTEYCSQASSVHVIHFSTWTHARVHARTHTHTHTHNTHMLLPTYLWVLTRPPVLGPLLDCFLLQIHSSNPQFSSH